MRKNVGLAPEFAAGQLSETVQTYYLPRGVDHISLLKLHGIEEHFVGWIPVDWKLAKRQRQLSGSFFRLDDVRDCIDSRAASR